MRGSLARVEFRDYIDIVRRRWLVVALGLVLGLGAAGGLAALATPMYQATTRIFVSTQAVGSALEAFQGSSYTQQRMQSYVEVATDPLVLDPVIDDLDLDLSAEELAGQISASVVPDTVLIEIVATDPDPELVADIANGVAISLREVVVERLEEQVGEESTLVNLTVVKRGVAPDSPSSPIIALYLGVGGVLGLGLGIGIAFIIQALDTMLRSTRDVKTVTDSPVLGEVSYDPDASDHPIFAAVNRRSPRSEAFRALRTSLQFIDAGASVRSLVVTSSLPSEGKTTTAANLAIVLADAGMPTLLVDADLRRPRIADYLGIEGAVGLSDTLAGRAPLLDVLQPWGERGNLWVLPAGSRPPNPSELLGSTAMAELIDSLRGTFDRIVFDAPPLLPVTDAAVLSKLTDGAVVVCAVGRTRAPQLDRSMQTLQHIGARVLGLVVNMLPVRGPDSYGTYGYGYYEEDGAEEKGSRPSRRKGVAVAGRDRA